MRSVLLVLTLACFCQRQVNARPSFDSIAKPTFFDSYIIGGEEATPGEFPWQLSQQYLGATWSHTCGASLLSAKYALSAAHCVQGSAVSILRVIAGIHDREDPDGVIAYLLGYKIHEQYNSGPGTFPNDIAILTLATEIQANGANIQYASLPDNNDEQFVDHTCVISGWGRTSESNQLPQYLQKANIQVISTEECNTRFAPVSGATVTDGMVCLFDINEIGSCSGDSGGPLNCNYPEPTDARRVVAGVTSWGISGGDGVTSVCLKNFPSVYTRTSAYLDWIKQNTP